MSFLGAGFLAGLFGIVLPLAIHLFARRRRVTQPWGAMRFLREAKPSWKRRSLRLQDLLILLLRIAAVALLAFAFARPVLEVPLPPADGHELIMIVDRSPSTELGVGTDSPLNEEIHRRVAEVLERVPAEVRMRLFVNGGSPLRQLAPATGQPFNEPRNRTEWLRELQSVAPGATTVDWSEAIRDSLDEPSEWPAPASRNVLVIADAATHGWPLADARPDDDPEKGENPAEVWHTGSPGATISLVPLGVNHPRRRLPNLCIDRIEPEQRRGTPGKPLTIRAMISNRGTAKSSPETVRWTVSGQSATAAESAIPGLEPGATHEVVLKKVFPEAGPQVLRLEIDRADALANDNVATRVIDVVDYIPVAVFIDETPDRIDDPDSRLSCWAFAAAAGHPGSVGFGDHGSPGPAVTNQESDSIFHLQWLTESALGETDLERFAAVVWSVSDASILAHRREVAESLRSFVADGGGLWLRPPSQVKADAFNAAFFPHEYGLSPAGLVSIAPAGENGSDDKTIGLRPAREGDDDPFSRLAIGPLAELRASRHLVLNDPLPPSSRTLAEFEGGHPFVTSRQLGRGQVVLTALDAHPDSGNLAACVGYVPFVREILWRLSSGHSPRRNLSAGETDWWESLNTGDRIRTAEGNWLETPGSGENQNSADVAELPPIHSVSGAPGLFWVESAEDGSLTPFSVSGDPQESNLTPVSRSYLEQLNSIEGIEVLEPGALGQALEFTKQGPPSEQGKPLENSFQQREIWAWLLAGLLGFLILEVVLAHHLLTRRRSAAGRTAPQSSR